MWTAVTKLQFLCGSRTARDLVLPQRLGHKRRHATIAPTRCFWTCRYITEHIIISRCPMIVSTNTVWSAQYLNWSIIGRVPAPHDRPAGGGPPAASCSGQKATAVQLACGRDRGPNKYSSKSALNRTRYRKSQKIPMSSPRLASLIKLGLALS